MKTLVNGKPFDWTIEVARLFDETISDAIDKGKLPNDEKWFFVDANYFTPRPYRNEYDQGSNAEGFIYTIFTESGKREVCQSLIRGK